jgi:type IV secretion system protein VirD4
MGRHLVAPSSYALARRRDPGFDDLTPQNGLSTPRQEGHGMPIRFEDDGFTDEQRELYRRRKLRTAWIVAIGLMALLAWPLNAWGAFWFMMILFGLFWLVAQGLREAGRQIDRVIRPAVPTGPTLKLNLDDPLPEPPDARYWTPEVSKDKPHGDARLGTGDSDASTPWRREEARGAGGVTCIPVGRSKLGRIRYYDGDRHLMTIAPNRSGKGRGCIMPALLTFAGSCVVNDPKGENCAVTARRRRELGQAVRILNPFRELGLSTDSLNPLDFMDPEGEDLREQADMVADMLVLVHAGDRDAHWSDEAKALISGLVLHVVTSEPPERRHLPRVRELLTDDQDTWAGTLLAMQDSKAAGGLVRRAANRFLQKSPEEASGVISTAHRHTEILDEPRLVRVLSSSSFSLTDLRTSRTTLYLILPPDRLPLYSRWLRLMYGLTINTLSRTPRRAGKPPVLVIVDEAKALGYMKPLETATSLLAGYGLQLWTFWQDLAQLKGTYRDTWTTFESNAGVTQVFDVRDGEAARYWSQAVGTTTVKGKSTGRNRGSSDGRAETTKEDSDSVANQNRSKGKSEGESESESLVARPLLLPEEVRDRTKLNPGDPRDSHMLVLLAGEPHWLLLKRLAYDLDGEFAGTFDPNPLHVAKG